MIGAFAMANAGEYLIKTWEVDDGLPENAVTDVAQSADGYIWAGTLNSGLSRFDGVRFVNFDSTNAPELGGKGVRRLMPDAEGTLWINGFGSGLVSCRAGTFRLEYPAPVVIASLVLAGPERAVFSTPDGQLLQGTTGPSGVRSWQMTMPKGATVNSRFFADREGGIWYRYPGQQLIRFLGEREGLIWPTADHQPITALAGDATGIIAVGTRRGLFLWQNGQFVNATPVNSEFDLSVKGLVSDGNGGWWVEANNRLRHCKDREWTAEAADWNAERRSWVKVRHEQADGQGGLWFAYVNGGLMHVSNRGDMSTITTREGLPSNTVRGLFQDRERNIWVSFERSGLARVRRRLFDAVGKDQGLADPIVTSVCEDHSGAIWTGSFGGSISRFENGTCTNFTLPRLGTHCEKSLVIADEAGRVWIGTHGNGLWTYEEGVFQQILAPKEIGTRVRALLVQRDQRIWVASAVGLFFLSGGDHRQIFKRDNEYPVALSEGVGGVIWAGLNTGGLLKWDGSVLSEFRPESSALKRFSAVHADADGTVWIGTRGAGLLRFREGTFKAITASQGLPSNTISQIIEDNTGTFWFGSHVGVFSVTKAGLNACADGSAPDVSSHLYSRDDGLPTLGCAVEFQPTAWRGQDERLWFATGNGVTSLQPHEISVNEQPPPVVIEELGVDGKLHQSIKPSQERVVIAPGRHQLEFRYTGLSFTSPERMRFKYQLEGLDNRWIEAGGDRRAAYNSVPAGEYRFRVMACNSDGIWSPANASLQVMVRPHIWETWWFRSAAIVGLLLAVAGTVLAIERRRTRQSLALLERQQALERERERIARDLHDDLGAGLTEIGLLGALAKRSNAGPERIQEHLSHITTRSREMVTSLDEMVWSLNPKHDSLVALSQYFCEYAQQFLQLAPVRCRMEVSEDLPKWMLSSEQRHHLLLAFKEALANVVRHSRAAEVRISIKMVDGSLVITIADDGQGLSQTRPRMGADGITNLSRRMESVGGCSTVRDGDSGGTVVELFLPILAGHKYGDKCQ
jgi:signal transduction histidine kinase/ligand-binding sensor domain-containing protein